MTITVTTPKWTISKRRMEIVIKNPVKAMELLTFLNKFYGVQEFSYMEGSLKVSLHTEWNIGRFEGEVELFLRYKDMQYSAFKVY